MVDEWDERAFEDEFPTFDDDGHQHATTPQQLQQQTIGCPYCGEPIDILLDTSEPNQEYIEDCSVCCRPITMVTHDDGMGGAEVAVYTSDDVF